MPAWAAPRRSSPARRHWSSRDGSRWLPAACTRRARGPGSGGGGGGASTSIRPSTRWISSSHSSATAGSWVASRTTAPRLASIRSWPTTRSRLASSSSLVGSSARSTSASRTSARATATRWSWPPDSSEISRSASSSTPTRASASERLLGGLHGGDSAATQGDGDVLGRGERGDQAVALEDEAGARAAARPASWSPARRRTTPRRPSDAPAHRPARAAWSCRSPTNRSPPASARAHAVRETSSRTRRPSTSKLRPRPTSNRSPP